MTDTSGLDDHQRELLEMEQKVEAAGKLILEATRIHAQPTATELESDGSLTLESALRAHQLLEAGLAPLLLALRASYRLHARTYKALRGKPMPETPAVPS